MLEQQVLIIMEIGCQILHLQPKLIEMSIPETIIPGTLQGLGKQLTRNAKIEIVIGMGLLHQIRQIDSQYQEAM